ncbi:MAG: aldo/keto reductase [Alphaproteobacteria bacterium]|nr:aldo/keto reductase [Alphaproteobacteria bacterium]
MMETRPFGKTGLRVSELGFGTSQIGNTDHTHQGVKFMAQEDATAILDMAVHEGVTFFDTGRNYGSSERQMGDLRRRHGGESLTIATKAGLIGNQTRDFTRPFLEKSVEDSLAQIGGREIDVFQVNKPTLEQWRTFGIADTLARLKGKGRVRHTGLIVGELAVGYEAVRSRAVDCIQVLYNLLYHETDELIASAHQAGIAVIVRSPLNSGLLSGRYTTKTTFDANDARSTFFTGEEFNSRLESLRRIQEDLGVSSDALLGFAIRFILSRPDVSTVIPAASTPHQLMAYVQAAKAIHQMADLSHDERRCMRAVVETHLLLSSSQIQNI